MINKKFILAVMVFGVAFVSYMRQNDIFNVQVTLDWIWGILFWTFLQPLYQVFTSVFAPVLTCFFLIKAIYLFSISDPNKYIAVADLWVMTFVIALSKYLESFPGNEYGWRYAYIWIVCWIIYTRWRKSLFN